MYHDISYFVHRVDLNWRNFCLVKFRKFRVKCRNIGVQRTLRQRYMRSVPCPVPCWLSNLDKTQHFHKLRFQLDLLYNFAFLQNSKLNVTTEKPNVSIPFLCSCTVAQWQLCHALRTGVTARFLAYVDIWPAGRRRRVINCEMLVGGDRFVGLLLQRLPLHCNCITRTD